MDIGKDGILFDGNILYLTEDMEMVMRQLNGEQIALPSYEKLMDNISTDEITPARVCYYYDKTLGEYCLVGLRGDKIRKGSIAKGNFEVIVSGYSKGCGSSRETAPYSELYSGIKLVIAKSIEKIYMQNCQNIGLLVTTDFSILEKIRKYERIPFEELFNGMDEISSEIVRCGGLFKYSKLRSKGELPVKPILVKQRPMTMIEKIIAPKVVLEPLNKKMALESVKPGDSLWVRADLRFSHEYVTPMASFLFRNAFGESAQIEHSESVVVFRDHLVYLNQVMAKQGEEGELLMLAEDLPKVQKQFSDLHKIKLYDGTAICHTGVMEDFALPGQIIVGTDSHTCTAGALGCFSFGIGATDMANAWYTREVRIIVPETILIKFEGQMLKDVSAKDIMLKLLSMPFVKEGKVIGKAIEFRGAAIIDMPVEERATLTNMAVEMGAFTAVVAPDEKVVDYVSALRGVSKNEVRRHIVLADEGAKYESVIKIDLNKVKPMVALPGDPRQGIDICQLKERVKVDIAYGGSCTGGKKTDMDMYAEVLLKAKEEGKKIHPETVFYIQFSSFRVKEYAKEKGYIDLFKEMGVLLLDPGCGACINAGPGITNRQEEVAISSINRNFRGRSGKGQVYLASPKTIAASAIAGFIVEPK